MTLFWGVFLTLNIFYTLCVSIVDFEQVNVSWGHTKLFIGAHSLNKF